MSDRRGWARGGGEEEEEEETGRRGRVLAPMLLCHCCILCRWMGARVGGLEIVALLGGVAVALRTESLAAVLGFCGRED